ncbi:class I SAM-dependent methyltransferase [Natrononativus amylolyticus]|uniref:class I SAM-dependent methyltransferase n=1 Tax=Natrononativus amylolyticus TaxID=2963434 RepID=UPI0020CB81C0|nr:class I SAM-dependent methyltransferase [Natrononativus amylolyticus]
MDAEEYFDDVAAFYDAVYRQQADSGDVAFYREIAREVDGSVLEVGCGTGRIYLELRRDGVDAYGIDVSTGMLEVLRENATEAGLESRVRAADVRSFEPEREYALVIVPFRAFLHLLETDEQLAALESIHDALAPGGRLVLNAFTPNFEVICERYGECEERDLEVDGRSYTYRVRSELADEVEQYTRIRSVVLDADDRVVLERETRIALLSRREFDLLFRLSPFEEWTVSGGFEGGDLESASQEMVWTARRTA